MKRIALTLCALLLSAPAHAQLGTPDPNVGGGNAASPPTLHRPADPDQPQWPGMNPWCAGCAAGFSWLCPGCGGLGPKGWQLGDWW